MATTLHPSALLHDADLRCLAEIGISINTILYISSTDSNYYSNSMFPLCQQLFKVLMPNKRLCICSTQLTAPRDKEANNTFAGIF